VTGEWSRLGNDELFDLYSQIIFIRVNETRSMRWALHVGRIESGEMHAWFWWRDLK